MDSSNRLEVGVLGLGTMGHGIAQCFAVKGHRVRMFDADPEFPMAHAQHAVALRALGYDRRARESASRAEALVAEPRTAAERRLALRIRAIRAEAFSRLDEAVEATGRLIELYPDEPTILNLHANMLRRAGEYDGALEVFARSLELDPLGAATWLGRGRVLLQAPRAASPPPRRRLGRSRAPISSPAQRPRRTSPSLRRPPALAAT